MNNFTVLAKITELLTAGAILNDIDKASHLLLTLSAVCDGIITAIERLLKDYLTVAFVNTRILDQEVQLKAENTDTSAKLLQMHKI